MDVGIACGVAFVKPGDFPALSHHFPSLLKSLNPTKSQGPKSPFLNFFSWIFFNRTGHSTHQQAASHAEFRHAHVFGPKAKSPQLPLPPPPSPLFLLVLMVRSQAQ